MRAVDNGADVLNASWHLGESYSRALTDAFDYAYSQGCVSVASAGNGNQDALLQTPANLESVITVAATDHLDRKASFSNYGSKVDVSAPGVSILSTMASGRNDIIRYNRLKVNAKVYDCDELIYSPETPAAGISGPLKFAGYGLTEDFASGGFRGKIALIERGEISFKEKVANAGAAGAVGAVIFNNACGSFFGTLQELAAIPAVSISREDGLYLKGLNFTTATIKIHSLALRPYAVYSGTSMSSPAVAGLAALILKHLPTEPVEAVRARIRASADPVSADCDGAVPSIGSGRINAYKALTLPRQPHLLLRDVRVEEEQGDGDQIPESNERIRLILTVENIWKSASTVSATISTSSPLVKSVQQGTSQFGAIVEGEAKENAVSPFVFTLDVVPCGAPIDLTMTTSADGVSQTFPIQFHGAVRKLPVHPSFYGGFGITMSEDGIAWVDIRNGDPGAGLSAENQDIYFFDSKTNRERRITSSPNAERFPVLSAGTLVWSEYRDFFNGIYLYDLATSTEQLLARDSFGRNFYVTCLAMSGNNVVWTNYYDNDESDVLLYDLASGIERNLTNDPLRQERVDVDGDKIVYVSDDWRIPPELFLYDVAAGQQRQITMDPAEPDRATAPRVSGDKVYWRDWRDALSASTIYCHDLATGLERPITSPDAVPGNFKVDGDLLVMEDFRGQAFGEGGLQVYVVNTVTGVESQLTFTPYKKSVAISGTRIAWSAYKGGGQADEIYIAEFNMPPAVGSVAPSSGSGNAGQWIDFTTTHSDPNGWKNVKRARFLVGPGVSSAAGSALMEYRPETNQLFLRDDADSAWLGGVTPGSAAAIENEQVIVDCGQTTVTTVGDTITIAWKLRFKPAYAGKSLNSYLSAKDTDHLDTGWIQKGSWSVL